MHNYDHSGSGKSPEHQKVSGEEEKKTCYLIPVPNVRLDAKTYWMIVAKKRKKGAQVHQKPSARNPPLFHMSTSHPPATAS